MEKNQKERFKATMFVLVVAFLFSTDLVWELISLISPKNYYVAFQFLGASFFALYSLMMTKDIEIFQEYWQKHPKREKALDYILKGCTVFIIKFPLFLLSLPDIISGRTTKEQKAQDKEYADDRIKKINEMPLIARCIVLPGFLTIVWAVAMNLWNYDAIVNMWISKALDFLVSLLGLFFLKVAVKDYICEKEKAKNDVN